MASIDDYAYEDGPAHTSWAEVLEALAETFGLRSGTRAEQ
jgi:hypothetical protein